MIYGADVTNADDFIPTRQSLLSRLKNWDNADSWRDFFNTYSRLIFNFARKAGLDETQAEDAVQETVISVAGQMQNFKYDARVGSFKSWLLQIARRRCADQLRKRYRSGEVGALNLDDPVTAALLSELPALATDTLTALWDEEWRKHIGEAAMQKVKRRVRPEQFQMFELSIVESWPARKVAEALGVSTVQVYMARHRVGKLIKKEVEYLEEKML